MTKRLLDRQVSLIHYLTSSGAIFGDAERRPADPVLRGIDKNLLGMEARFSFEKRIEKIDAVLPRTFDLLGAQRELLIREFVESYPPADIGRLENARQFCDFIRKRDRREPIGHNLWCFVTRTASEAVVTRASVSVSRLSCFSHSIVTNLEVFALMVTATAGTTWA